MCGKALKFKSLFYAFKLYLCTSQFHSNDASYSTERPPQRAVRALYNRNVGTIQLLRNAHPACSVSRQFTSDGRTRIEHYLWWISWPLLPHADAWRLCG